MSQDPPPNAARPVIPGPAGVGGVLGFSPLPTGTRIGELVVQSVLGAGDFAITYIAEHEKRSKRYALKEYFPRAIALREGLALKPRQASEATYAWGLERFLNEASKLQHVRHRGIISVLGITQLGGTGYVGMTYENGVDFSIWLHEHKKIAPQQELDAILAPLLEGLSEVHAANVFHLDMTPDSIIVRESGTPVLVDFGVFRVGLRRRLPPGNLAALIYAAPELLTRTGGPVGPWTDVYSLAGLLYLAVAGRPPLSAAERANGAALQPAVVAAQGRYRSEFLAAIDAGLKLEPAQRPHTIADWSKDLLRPQSSRFALPRLLARRPAAAPDAPATTTSPRAGTHAPASAAPPPPETVSLGGTPVPTDTVATPLAPAPAPLMQHPAVRRILFGSILLLGGALAGAILSIPLASLLRTDCSGGDCATPFVLPLALIGALIGLWEGVRYADRTLLNIEPREPYEL